MSLSVELARDISEDDGMGESEAAIAVVLVVVGMKLLKDSRSLSVQSASAPST